MYDNERRDVDGRARSFVCGAPISAEATTLLVAVELAVSYDASTIIFSDCLTLAKALQNQPDQWPWEAAAILASTSQIMRDQSNISIFHVGREEVREADILAKRARDNPLVDVGLF
ncbi:hypothetical protein LINPERHAP2_LOCUS2509 [Linum perenne]